MTNNSSNPSDYEFLIRTLIEGKALAKSQSLKRLNTLIASDKKQFATYAKRIVLALPQMMIQPKEDINFMACTLALEIITLNPRDIEFYVRTKLLKYMVYNLGDIKPQIRKTSHYCLLSFIRTYKNFDDLIDVYISEGFASPSWQLRQKAINSFQSILVMEIRYLNWTSPEFKKIFEFLLSKLKEENPFVQKAAEQCLLSLSKVEEIRMFAKRLSGNYFTMLLAFSQAMHELGNLQEIKLDFNDENAKKQERFQSRRHEEKPSNRITEEKVNRYSQDETKVFQNSVSLIDKSSKILQKSQMLQNKKAGDSPVKEQRNMKKAQSSLKMTQHKEKAFRLTQQIKTKEITKTQQEKSKETNVSLPPISNQPQKQQKIENLMARKLIQDLKNEKDWKVRLSAIEQFQTKFQVYNQSMETQVLMKIFIPILIKLLSDSNFKVALISLKIIEEMMHLPKVSIESIVPQVVQKLADNKVALRQNISKMIKSQYNKTHNPCWIDNLLNQIKKPANNNVKEEVLNILSKLYDQPVLPTYPFEKIIETVTPLMDDLKTKVKIKTLDILADITIKTQKIDRVKSILATKMNQVYYEMYLQKISKLMRSMKITQQKQHPERSMRNSMNIIKRNKVGNTTSSSLNRYKTKDQQNTTVKTTFYEPKQNKNINRTNKELLKSQSKVSINTLSTQQRQNQTEETSFKRYQPKSFRKRTNRSIQSRISTSHNSADQSLPPFTEPTKEIKAILSDLKSDDWQVSLQTLTKIRRIILHHSQLLSSSNIKGIVPDLMKLTQSLRSSLSKNAVVTLNELVIKCKRMIDPELDIIFSRLIKRTLDTSSFISEEVKKCLINVSSNANQNKVMNLIINSQGSRAIPIKTALVNILENITFLPKFYDKQLEKIIGVLVYFMNQASLEIRQRSKNLLNNIIMSEKGPQMVRLIPHDQRSKLRKIQEQTMSHSKMQLEVQQLEEKPKEIEVQQKRNRKKKSKIQNFPQEFQQIQKFLEKCESSDWRQRLDSMTKISQICAEYPEEMSQFKLSSKFIDVLSKQINDPNLKVATNALKIFQNMTAVIPGLIENNLSVILNQIFNCFASTKAQIRFNSQVLFDKISQTVQKWMLTQHICNGALYSHAKSKPTIINKLTKLIPDIHKVKPNIFTKNVYPTINKLADENKPDINHSLRELMEVLYTEVGEECMGALKQKAKALLFQ